MRCGLALAALLAGFAASGAGAGQDGPAAASGYRVDVVRLPGTRLSGLAECGDRLLLTDLAAGRILQLDEAGSVNRLGPELPYGTDVIGDPTGPYRIAVGTGGLIVAQGWTPVDRGESPYDHSLLRIDPAGGVTVLSSDFWNPFDFVVDGDTVYVIDAARNSLERLDADGMRTTLHRFPRLEFEATRLSSLSPTEFTEKEVYRVDAVPTGLAYRGDRIFVSLFGGFPYLERAGAVVSLDRAALQAPARVEARGLDNPVDLDFDGAGTLFVLEHGRFDQASGFLPGSGRLTVVGPGIDERRGVLTGLTRPVTLLMLASGKMAVASLDGTVAIVTPHSLGVRSESAREPCCNAPAGETEFSCHEDR